MSGDDTRARARAVEAMSRALEAPRPPAGMQDRVRMSIEWPLRGRRRWLSRRFIIAAVLLVPAGALAGLAMHRAVISLTAPRVDPEVKSPLPPAPPPPSGRHELGRQRRRTPDREPRRSVEGRAASGVSRPRSGAAASLDAAGGRPLARPGKSRHPGPAQNPAPGAPGRHPEQTSGRVVGHPPAPLVAAQAPPPAASSEVAQQVRRYKELLELQRLRPVEALDQWRAFRRRWPHSLLTQEADLQIIDALSRLGRAEEARTAIRRFLRQHPRSPRAEELRALLRSAPATGNSAAGSDPGRSEPGRSRRPEREEE